MEEIATEQNREAIQPAYTHRVQKELVLKGLGNTSVYPAPACRYNGTAAKPWTAVQRACRRHSVASPKSDLKEQ